MAGTGGQHARDMAQQARDMVQQARDMEQQARERAQLASSASAADQLKDAGEYRYIIPSTAQLRILICTQSTLGLGVVQIFGDLGTAFPLMTGKPLDLPYI